MKEREKKGRKGREKKVKKGKKAGKSEFKSRDYYSRDSNQHLKVDEYLGDEKKLFLFDSQTISGAWIEAQRVLQSTTEAVDREFEQLIKQEYPDISRIICWSS